MNDWKVNFLVSALSVGIGFLVAGHLNRHGNGESHTDGRDARLAKMEPEGYEPITRTIHILGKQGLLVGLWGGEHISLQVTEHGATVEYDCGHGTISRRIFLDRQGRFDVQGTHFEEHGGPIRETEQLNSYPVRFTGRIRGKIMKLTVRRGDTRELIGVFTLIYGQEPLLIKCR